MPTFSPLLLALMLLKSKSLKLWMEVQTAKITANVLAHCAALLYSSYLLHTGNTKFGKKPALSIKLGKPSEKSLVTHGWAHFHIRKELAQVSWFDYQWSPIAVLS